jgi:hypothetical protein
MAKNWPRNCNSLAESCLHKTVEHAVVVVAVGRQQQPLLALRVVAVGSLLTFVAVAGTVAAVEGDCGNGNKGSNPER